MWNSNGQVSVTVALIAASGTILTAIAGALGTSFLTSSTQVAVIEEREQNHYNEVQSKLTEQGAKINQINDKLDVLLYQLGGKLNE